jgi:protein-tyrosine phosphatase
MCPNGLGKKLHLFLEFAQELQDEEVPDPYYGGSRGFERVFDMVKIAAEGLLDDIRSKHSI